MSDKDYKAQIDRAIQEMSGEYILNGSADHATIIVERMFAHAKSTVRILSRRFDQRIFGKPDTVAEADAFMADPNRTAYLLLEEYDPVLAEGHEFFRRLAKHQKLENLHIKKLTAEQAGRVDVNFAVMDETGIRFEDDKNEPVATATFGRKSLNKGAVEFFDDLWKNAVEVKLPVFS